jgi:DNA helicase HerA-like ATPase
LVGILDMLIVTLALLSLIILLRNILASRELRIPIRLRKGEELKVNIGGSTLVGYALIADRIPSGGDGGVAERLVEIAKSMRVSVTFTSSMFKVESGKLLGFIEDEIRKVELVYNATKHVRYAERLRFLNELYRTVAKDHKPYVGSLGIVLWLPQGDPDNQRVVEAFRSLVEAEAGVTLRKLGSSFDVIEGLIASVPPVESAVNAPVILVTEDDVSDRRGVILGRMVDSEGVLVLDWPRDFEAHIGVLGPTGRGKTVMLAGIAAQLGMLSDVRLDPYMVLVIDPKGDLRNLLSKVASKVVRPGGYCIPLPRLDGVAEELVKSSVEAGWGKGKVDVCRGSLIERGLVVYDLTNLGNEDRNVASSLIVSSLVLEASEKGLPGRVVLVVDEAWRVAIGSANHMIMALREGRSKGLYVIYATQSPSDLPQAILDNTRVVVAFGGFTKNYAELARRLGLEEVDKLLRLPVGEAYVRVGDRPPLRIYAYNYKAMLGDSIVRGVEAGVSSSEGPRGDREER